MLSIISMIKGPFEAENIMRNFGKAASIIGIVYGIILIIKQGNFTLLLASIVIFIYNI